MTTNGSLAALVAVIASARHGHPTVALDALAGVYPDPRERAQALGHLRALDPAAWRAIVAVAYRAADRGDGAALPEVARLLGYTADAVRAHRGQDPEVRALATQRAGKPRAR
jgi:hypothetical protein